MRLILFFLLFIINAITQPLYSQNNITVLKGGTIIDVDNYGQSSHDIKNAIVIIQHGKIISVGVAGKIKIPEDATVHNLSGKFIVPGLIDGFGSVTNQAFANAYLYMGVTSVVTVEDNRRGKTFTNASPSPTLYKQDAYWGADRVEANNKPYKFENVNYRNEAAIRHDIDSLVQAGAKVLLVHYGVKLEQLPAIIAACKAHHIATVGELGFTFYRDAVLAGIQSFVHTSRYTADILPDSVRAVYSNAPFGPPSVFYYNYILKPGILSDPTLVDLANIYANHPIGLMPTGSRLVYPFMPFAKNPWNERAASLIDEKDILHEPLDKQTGKPINPAPYRVQTAPVLMAMDSLFAHKGAHFLTGSGATAFGTLPGISLHTELEILSHAGLTNREVIAAATNNFSLLWNWKHIGKIEAGREADLLVLSGNPLESLNHLKDIDILLLKGKIIEREQLLKK
jgi:Amidohydrolase family